MIWFWTAYAELSAKRSSLSDLMEQLHLHEGLYFQSIGGPNAQSSAGMLETSRMLYREAAKGYNLILQKPFNRIPAMFLGFRPSDEDSQGEMRGEKV